MPDPQKREEIKIVEEISEISRELEEAKLKTIKKLPAASEDQSNSTFKINNMIREKENKEEEKKGDSSKLEKDEEDVNMKSMIKNSFSSSKKNQEVEYIKS
mmetsp:Transcript_9025/g.8444  ORF Transcript_9025/g.8444 Transcript_9025/m.8444 type:complete len:101 (+) Transcript_9025:190-492(+)